MKLNPFVVAAFTLSSAVTAAIANVPDKSAQPSNSSYSSTLSSNGDSTNVSQIQQALISKGFNAGPVDGKMGAKTKSALKQFQQAQGMQPSGQLDSQTLVALNAGAGTPSSTQATTDTSASTPSSQPDASTSSQPSPSASTSASQPGASSSTSASQPSTSSSTSPSQPSS